MALIKDYPDLTAAMEPASPEDWTAIIPAAGKGSRLKSSLPKILYPVAGRPILDWLLMKLKHVCRRFIIVLSPDGEHQAGQLIRKRLENNVRIVIQTDALGMADAIARSLPFIESPYSLILWGDQCAIRSDTLNLCTSYLQSHGASAAFPTYRRKDPYIDFQCNTKGQLYRVLQKREGDTMPDEGESDAGLFLFKSPVLTDLLPTFLEHPLAKGRVTRELNFLPWLPLLDQSGIGVHILRILHAEETVGVNDRADVDYLSRHLLFPDD